MSNTSEKNSTKDRIVDKAIELYNMQGVEYVGVRELAKELHMKGGNITYYFPTKDDLVLEISSRLAASNEQILKKDAISLGPVLEMLTHLYNNQYQYRALFVSMPNLLRQNEGFRKQYTQHQQPRRNTFAHIIEQLSELGYLRKMEKVETQALLKAITLQNRFWISEATADQLITSKEKAITHYIGQAAGLFYTFATTKGRKELMPYLQK